MEDPVLRTMLGTKWAAAIEVTTSIIVLRIRLMKVPVHGKNSSGEGPSLEEKRLVRRLWAEKDEGPRAEV
jgi:hypothetical protein